jgi:hypothetical protein
MISKSQFIIFSALLATAGAPETQTLFQFLPFFQNFIFSFFKMISKSQFIIFSALLATAGAPGEVSNDWNSDKFAGPLEIPRQFAGQRPSFTGPGYTLSHGDAASGSGQREGSAAVNGHQFRGSAHAAPAVTGSPSSSDAVDQATAQRRLRAAAAEARTKGMSSQNQQHPEGPGNLK